MHLLLFDVIQAALYSYQQKEADNYAEERSKEVAG